MNESTKVRYDRGAGRAHARAELRRQMSMSFYAGEIDAYVNARAADASNAQALGEGLVRRSIITREDLKLLDAKMMRTVVEEQPPQVTVLQIPTQHRRGHRQESASSEGR
jgi:hypothetical protein